MALDMADSQYLLILAPSLVIALMFLFFWLFMKETSYDEVLARQKRDLKLPPAKPDTRKKNEKKKNKKKETGGSGLGGGGGGESEEDLRDFDTSDATSPISNDEDSEVVPMSPPVAAPVLAEPPSGIRERKKKEKKPKASPTAAPVAAPTVVPLSRTTPTTPPTSEEPEVNGSKPAVRKDPPLPLTKQSSPPQPQATPPAPTETTSKKKAKKQKSESVAEAHVQSSAPVTQTDSTTSTNHQSNQNNEAPSPAPAPTKHGKKQKSETNKERHRGDESSFHKLQQENGILRDAVERCSTTNQMETKQSSELNKLHSECNGLMKELAETKNKLQQEELQRKSLEVNYKQNVSQLEDAKRRWEELQNYLHNVSAEREKLQSAKQELQNQMMAVESEITSKNKEIQTLHSSLTETLIFKEQEQQKVKHLEQKVMQLLEASQHTMQPDDQLQEQVQDLLKENKMLKVQIDNLQTQLNTQATTVSHFDELQKLLAEKEIKRKSLEDSLNAERSSSAGREIKMQAIHNENLTVKTDVQNLQAQISEQAVSMEQLKQSLQQRDEKVRMVENLLESSLIQVANKEDELKAIKNEYEDLKQQLELVQKHTTEQTMSEKTLEELQQKIQVKDEKIRSVEGSLQSAMNNESERTKAMEDLQQQVETLNTELAQLRSRETKSSSDLNSKIQELHVQLTAKDQDVERLQRELEKEIQQQQQTVSAVPSQELTALAEKNKQLSDLQEELLELRESVELHRKKNNELREKNWSAMEALSATETILQGKLAKSAKEHQTVLESAETECRALLHRLLPHVPLPTDQIHQQWLLKFETSVSESSAGEVTSATASGAGDAQALAEKLKEAEEAQKVLQKDCETYKKVLAETEGILQRLQSSVEQEETCWREKLEQSQADLREMTRRVTALEQEVDRLSSDGDVESLRRDKQHMEAELERAECESATYVSEVRELKDLLTELQSKLDGSYTKAVRQNEELNLLKTRLTETLCKLETEESERQKVAGDLYKAQQSLELIQAEIIKEAGQADLIETSSLTQMEEIDRKEKMTAGLNQTVQELQELLQSINRQLTKGNERVGSFILS
ncbi:kinectin-like [Sinocyclocheilus grahami]|uniref:kinectin-like n=1 Tax=Sinocyclocheilus grahami TaxID=75366 RepID=UPI0007ACDEF5|nr:PREDICTED: kinectin-like [Sinocyclocheilus grahami]